MTNRGTFKGTGTSHLKLDNKRMRGLALPVDPQDAVSKRAARDGDANPPSYVAGRDLAYSFSALQGVYNYKSENTRHADQGLTNASRGVGTTGPTDTSQVGYTRELVIGDSVTAGCTGGAASNITYSRTEAWPYAMRDTMSLWGIPANGTGIYRCQDGSVTNTQFWTTTGTWTGGSNVTFISSTTVGDTATCTVDRPGTIVDVFYADGFSGTFTISVNGASSGTGFATVTAAGVSRTGKKRLALAGTANFIYPGSTIKIAVTTAGTGVGIIGVSVWTPNGGLVIDNVAQGGSKAGGVADRTSWTETTNVGAPWNVFGGNYKGGISGQRLTSTTITTTTGSASITAGSAIFDADAHTGVPIDFVPDVTKGIAFPPGTYIQTVTDSTHAVLSTLALTTNSANQTAYVDRDPSVVHICLGGNDLQNGRTAAQIAGDLTTLVGRVRAQWPNTDVILHLENELAPANASAAQELSMQQAMYALADTLNVPLYDWRDRAGSYATAMSNGIYADAVAHMTPAMYTNLGCALAFARCVAGSGPAQAVRGPSLDNDVTPKWYVDGFSRFKTPSVANGNTFSGTVNVVYNISIPPNILQVGDTVELECYGTYTATVVGAILGKLLLGTTGGTSDTLIATSPTTANAGATGAAFHLQGVGTVRTIGSSGTLEVVVYAHIDNTAIRISAPTQVAIDTTTRQFLSLCGQCSGGTSPLGTPNMAYHSTIRKG